MEIIHPNSVQPSSMLYIKHTVNPATLVVYSENLDANFYGVKQIFLSNK
jgi:hypothetical protein